MKKPGRGYKNFIIIFSIIGILTAGTAFAWYVTKSTVEADEFSAQAGALDNLIVKVLVENEAEKEKVLLSQVANGSKQIDIGLAELTNIEEGKLAPGAFGEIHFYVTSNSMYYTGCEIEIEPEYMLINNINQQNGNITVEKLKSIINNHILFFNEKAVSGITGETVYGDRILYTDGRLKVKKTLTINKEEEIVIYWYWPYDYNEMLPYADSQSGIDTTGALEENIRKYDMDDTLIGNYLESITLRFTVEGTQSGQ